MDILVANTSAVSKTGHLPPPPPPSVPVKEISAPSKAIAPIVSNCRNRCDLIPLMVLCS